MNWDALGATAELFGAVAVIFTLIYLSIQIKQARNASDRAAYYAELQANISTVDMYSRWRTNLQNPSLLEVISKANSDESLSPEEQIGLSAAFDELFVAAAGAHLNSVKPDSLYEAKADIKYLATVFDTMPCAQKEWIRIRHIVIDVSPELVKAVDDYISRENGDA